MFDTLASLSEKITEAEIAQKKWKKLSINERIKFIQKFNEIFLNHKKEFVDLLISEIYKPKVLSEDEVLRTYDMVQMFCEETRALNGETRESGGYPGNRNNKMAMITRQPLGTVLCISPFNYPVNESLAKIIPALLMGNAVLFKAASRASKIGELIEKCFREAGMMEGVFSRLSVLGFQSSASGLSVNQFSGDENAKKTENCQTGGLISENRKQRTDNRDLIDFVVSHPLVDAINFTGSTETAEHISKICGIKKLVMGMSGKDASIVLSDADLDLAASEIVSGVFSYSGQRCTGIKRVLVQEKVHKEFLEKLKQKISASLSAGKLTDEKTNFGPMLEEKHADFVDELIIDAENLGAKVEKVDIMGGSDGSKMWGRKFMLPTVISGVAREMRIAWEEPFAPILPISSFEEINEAIEICNQSSYGLQNSVFTKNINLAFKICGELVCGVCNINGKDARGPDNFPFLGVKKSGLGVVGGIKYILEEMSTIKSIVVNLN